MSAEDEKNIVWVKQYICNVCLEIDQEDLKAVLNFLGRQHVSAHLFYDHPKGVKINLDLVDDHVVLNLYRYIKYRSKVAS